MTVVAMSHGELSRFDTLMRLKRGVFHSLVDLQAAINRFLDDHNESPTPFIWTADPDKITPAIRRGHQVLDSNQSLQVLIPANDYNGPAQAFAN